MPNFCVISYNTYELYFSFLMVLYNGEAVTFGRLIFKRQRSINRRRRRKIEKK